MTTMTNDPQVEGALEHWLCGDILCMLRNDKGPVPTGHVCLPDNLVDQWNSYTEAAVALSLAAGCVRCEVVDGPKPGFAQTGELRWLTISAYQAQAAAFSRGDTLIEDTVHKMLFRDAEIIAKRMQAASDYLTGGEGRSVKPVQPTYPHRYVHTMMVRTAAAGTRAEVMLRAGETSWNPAAAYRPFVGNAENTTTIRYEITLTGITATEL